MTGTDAPYDSVIRAASIVLAFVMGAFAGSFLNVVADRLPAGGSLVSPRSYCMACLRRIPVRDLAPILGYAWLRGRCRRCGVRIPVRVVAVEAVSAALFALAYLKLGYGLAFGVFCACAALLLAIAVIDLEHRIIPNRLVVPASFVLVILAPFWPDFGIDREFVFEHARLASFVNSLVAGVGGLSVLLGREANLSAGDGSRRCEDGRDVGLDGRLPKHRSVDMGGRSHWRRSGSGSAHAWRAWPQGRYTIRPISILRRHRRPLGWSRDRGHLPCVCRTNRRHLNALGAQRRCRAAEFTMSTDERPYAAMTLLTTKMAAYRVSPLPG